MSVHGLKAGDIITIPRDQYGRPVVAFDPVTMEPTKQLQKFVITGDTTGTHISLRLYRDPSPWRHILRQAFYKSGQESA